MITWGGRGPATISPMAACPRGARPSGSSLRSPQYLGILLLAAIIGVPVSAASYGFLAVVDQLQTAVFKTIPHDLGFDTAPTGGPCRCSPWPACWWRWRSPTCPGSAATRRPTGSRPAGVFPPRELPGMVLAALAGLSLGVVIGPEAPLILLGSGLGALAMRWRRAMRRDTARP